MICLDVSKNSNFLNAQSEFDSVQAIIHNYKMLTSNKIEEVCSKSPRRCLSFSFLMISYISWSTADKSSCMSQRCPLVAVWAESPDIYVQNQFFFF